MFSNGNKEPLPPPIDREEFLERFHEYELGKESRKKEYLKKTIDGYKNALRMYYRCYRLLYFLNDRDNSSVFYINQNHQTERNIRNRRKDLHKLIIVMRKVAECCYFLDYLTEGFDICSKIIGVVEKNFLSNRLLYLTYGVMARISLVQEALDLALEYINKGLKLHPRSKINMKTKDLIERRMNGEGILHLLDRVVCMNTSLDKDDEKDRIEFINSEVNEELFKIYFQNQNNILTINRFLIMNISSSNHIEPRTSKDYCRRGYSHFERKQFEKAIECYNKAIELKPGYSRPYVYRAETLLALRKFEEVIEDCNKALEIDPRDHYCLYLRAFTSLELGHFENCILDSTKAIKFDTKILDNPALLENPDYYHIRSCAYFSLRQFEKAIEDTSLILELVRLRNYKNEAMVFSTRGLCYNFTGYIEKAIVDLKKAIEILPTDSNSLASLGFSYRCLKQYDKAIEYFEKSIQLDELNPWTYYFRGLVFKDQHNYTEAVADFERSLEYKPREPLLHLVSNELKESQGILGDLIFESLNLKK